MPGPRVRVHSPLQRLMQAANENPVRPGDVDESGFALRAIDGAGPVERAPTADEASTASDFDIETELMHELQSSFESIRRPLAPFESPAEIQEALDDPYSHHSEPAEQGFAGLPPLNHPREEYFADDPPSAAPAYRPSRTAGRRLPQAGQWVFPETAVLPEEPDLPAADRLALDDFDWQSTEPTGPRAHGREPHPQFRSLGHGAEPRHTHDVMSFGRPGLPADEGLFPSDEAADPDAAYAAASDDDPEAKQHRPARRSGGATKFVGVALGVVFVAGASALYLNRSDGLIMTASGPPPLIAADTSPIKIVPVATAETNKLILDPIEANRDVVVAQSTEPVTELPQSAVNPTATDPLSEIIQPTGAAPSPSQDTAATSSAVVAPRMVRTVVMSPTGNVLDSSSVAVSPADSAAVRVAASSAVPSSAAVPARPVEISTMTTGSIPAPAETASAAPPARPAPAPAPAPVQVAAVTPAPATTAPAGLITVTPGQSGFVVSLASHRSEDQAAASFADLQRRYPSLLGNRAPSIVPANIPDRGIFYRVRVGPVATQAEAQSFCNQLKAAGQDCFVVAN